MPIPLSERRGPSAHTTRRLSPPQVLLSLARAPPMVGPLGLLDDGLLDDGLLDDGLLTMRRDAPRTNVWVSGRVLVH